jgi:enamine deaminase RidA (YjgF/YER057c/UK114 family)
VSVGTDEPVPYRTTNSRSATGTLLFVSGQIAMDGAGGVISPGDAAAQAQIAYSKVAEVLKENGCVPNDLVKLTTFLVDGVDLNTVLAIRAQVLVGANPAATTVYVAGLARPGLLIEVEAIATQSS